MTYTGWEMAIAKTDLPELGFPSARHFAKWLEKNHATCPGIWLCFAKKDSGLASVKPQEAVEAAICYGWIDGQIRPKDDRTYLVRYGPRAKRSIWSKINRERVPALMEQGRMRPAGMREVERAQQDGRWDAAYDSARTSTVPPDLAAALAGDPAAQEFFTQLSGQNRYAILFRLQTAKKAETRARRLAQFLVMLQEGRTIHPPELRRLTS